MGALNPVRDHATPVAIGVIGATWSASVNPDASIEITDTGGHRTVVQYAVASTERWHDPAVEPTLRRRRVEGSAVVEHRVHVPGGDVVVAVYAVPAPVGAGGVVVLAVSNDSSAPVALACSHPDAVGPRPGAGVAVEGIDLGPGAVSFPIGHRTAVTVAIPVDGARDLHVNRLPDAERVARGWLRQCDLRARYVVAEWTEQITAARCELLLAHPRPADPVGELLAAEELHQMGHGASLGARELARLGESAARHHGDDVLAPVALRAAARLLHGHGETRAALDALRLADAMGAVGVHPALSTVAPHDPGRFLHWVRAHLMSEQGVELCLFPAWQTAWDGAGVELHDVDSTSGMVSAAVRWHGERPALLWDVRGAIPETWRVRCPGLDPQWSSVERRGEVLLRTATTTRR